MAEREGLVRAGDNPVTLLGDEVKVGDRAPDFGVIGNDMENVALSDYAGKVLVLASVPSLDTAVCSTETRRFNAEATGLGEDVAVLTISMDLPFAQKRWCGAEGIEHVVTLSDHRDASFGRAYGVLIKEMRLLARAVFVVDRGGVVRYTELVPVLGEEPDYESVLAAVKELT
jgi:thiol peroxidase